MDREPQTYGFTLTTADAAVALDITPSQMRQLVRSGMVGYLMVPDLTGRQPSQLRFHIDDLTAYQRAKKNGEIPVDRENTVRMTGYLREYLEMTPAEDDYETAIFKRAPLLASSKNGTQTYIKVDLFVDHMTEYAGKNLAPSIVEASLEYLGAIRRRGVVPLAESGNEKAQRWATWWRVPPFLLPDNDDDDHLVGDMVESLLPGEQVKRQRGGPAFLADSPLGNG